jgi:ribonuclease R
MKTTLHTCPEKLMSKSRKKQSTPHKSPTSNLRTIILELLNSQPNRAFSKKHIAKKIGLKKRDDVKMAIQVIHELESEGQIRQLGNGNFATNVKQEQFVGIIDHVSSRFAYVTIGEGRPDVYIKARDLKTAFHGDTVSIEVFPSRHGEHPEGRVTEIIKRSRDRFVGKIEVSSNYSFVVADFKKVHSDFFVHPGNTKGAKTSDKVIIEVVDWGGEDKNPTAKVVDVLGKAGENEAEIHSIMAEFGLPFKFPPQIEKDAKNISDAFEKLEIKKRWDFRETTTFTIDPEDAKDFDDALSFEILANGNSQVGVHIADVTFYVEPNSILEQ